MNTPQLNEIWQVQWQQGGSGEDHNILVQIKEDKKEFNPPNWRRNDFECEHKKERLVVSGNNFIERFMSAKDAMQPTVDDELTNINPYK